MAGRLLVGAWQSGAAIIRKSVLGRKSVKLQKRKTQWSDSMFSKFMGDAPPMQAQKKSYWSDSLFDRAVANKPAPGAAKTKGRLFGR